MASSWCPCPSPWESAQHYLDELLLGGDGDETVDLTKYYHRRLQDAAATPIPTPAPTEIVGELWEMIYVGVVLILMFAVLLSDRVGVSPPV